MSDNKDTQSEKEDMTLVEHTTRSLASLYKEGRRRGLIKPHRQYHTT
jgi:hypothetical protein